MTVTQFAVFLEDSPQTYQAKYNSVALFGVVKNRRSRNKGKKNDPGRKTTGFFPRSHLNSLSCKQQKIPRNAGSSWHLWGVRWFCFWNWFLQTYNLTRFLPKSRENENKEAVASFSLYQPPPYPPHPRRKALQARPSWKSPHAQGCDIEAPTAPDPRDLGPRSTWQSISPKHVLLIRPTCASPAVWSPRKEDRRQNYVSIKDDQANQTGYKEADVQAMKQKTLDTKDIQTSLIHHTGCHQQKYYWHTWLVLNMMHFPHWESGTD